MGQYIARRLLVMLLVAVLVTIVVFSILHLAPGCPARVIAGERATEERVAVIRSSLGLDRPLHIQYFSWLGRIVQGDFGRSVRTRRPVLPMIVERIPATLELTFAAMLLALIVAVPVGIISAVKQYSIFDHAGMVGALLGISMPNFWVGLMLLLVFGLNLRWFPISGRGGLEYLILPTITLGTADMALLARMQRTTLLEVVREDYVRTARAKGLAEKIVIYKHALKNAMIPLVTIVCWRLPWLIGGAVITETIFAWPGMGRLMVSAVFARDFAVVQATVLLMAILVVFGNLFADIIYAYLDPRIKYE